MHKRLVRDLSLARYLRSIAVFVESMRSVRRSKMTAYSVLDSASSSFGYRPSALWAQAESVHAMRMMHHQYNQPSKTGFLTMD